MDELLLKYEHILVDNRQMKASENETTEHKPYLTNHRSCNPLTPTVAIMGTAIKTSCAREG